MMHRDKTEPMVLRQHVQKRFVSENLNRRCFSASRQFLRSWQVNISTWKKIVLWNVAFSQKKNTARYHCWVAARIHIYFCSLNLCAFPLGLRRETPTSSHKNWISPASLADLESNSKTSCWQILTAFYALRIHYLKNNIRMWNWGSYWTCTDICSVFHFCPYSPKIK